MCTSTEAIAFMITYGFSAAVSTRVSNEVGDGNVDKAKNAVSVTLKLSVLVGVSFVLLLEFSNGLWAKLGGSTVVGLWPGMICSLACQACSLLVITVRTKWSRIVESMQEEKANYIA
ncbi:unnamed protein product [Miscanthus lutarioriparius]|uniref:Uncharacterized protein n=1 Tax=Miscanthus lutarioriparius TaxID=422564 RepID=A0A811P960_9POAL|nr:unnamed protein product [Miscanthus lutarioriparius]